MNVKPAINVKPASCKDCVMCVPGIWASTKTDFFFPSDTECGAGYDSYPDLAYMCPHFQYQENGYYDKIVKIVKGYN